jgi:hypothetical protein
MFEKANILDKLGLFKEADEFERKIIATNNYLLTKKKKPLTNINTSLDTLKSQMFDLKEQMEDNSGQGGDTNVVLDNKEVEFKEK